MTNNFDLTKENKTFIKLYDGRHDKEKSLKAEHLNRKKIDSYWNFFRNFDNFVYSKNAKIKYEGKCENNLVISNGVNINIEDVKNAFILGMGESIKIAPIHKVNKIMKLSSEIIAKEYIHYNTPKNILRESSQEIKYSNLENKLMEFYGIYAKKISPLVPRNASTKIYKIDGQNNKTYSLREMGVNKKRAESQAKVISKTQNYFPEIYSKGDNQEEYIVNIGDKLYLLEEFIENATNKKRDLTYFSLLGHHIANLNEQWKNLLKNNPEEQNNLESKGDFFNESNFISQHIDLSQNDLGHTPFLKKLHELSESGAIEKFRNLPKTLIHGDLNNSNLLWRNEKPTIIDPETLKISSRVSEFIPPLLLKGEKKDPDYVKDSAKKMVKEYNKNSNEPLTKSELNLLPNLLEIALIRHYTIRNIRRKNMDPEKNKKTRKNLEKISKIQLK